jgi:hypothetical protein
MGEVVGSGGQWLYYAWIRLDRLSLL